MHEKRQAGWKFPPLHERQVTENTEILKVRFSLQKIDVNSLLATFVCCFHAFSPSACDVFVHVHVHPYHEATLNDLLNKATADQVLTSSIPGERIYW